LFQFHVCEIFFTAAAPPFANQQPSNMTTTPQNVQLNVNTVQQAQPAAPVIQPSKDLWKVFWLYWFLFSYHGFIL